MVFIRVEEVGEEDSSPATKPDWTPWVDSVSDQLVGILSTNAPLQGTAIYFLGSLIPPLLTAMFDNIDFGPQSTSGIDVLHRLHRLMDLIVSAKSDAYLDVLETIAYHTPRAKQLAASVLVGVWPKATGHITVTRPLTQSVYLDNNPAMMRDVVRDHPHSHQFVPWSFLSTRHVPYHECRSCEKTLDGFGLHCPFCSCSVHFDCYDVPSGCHLVKYSMTSDRNVQKVALFRFSEVLAARRDFGPFTVCIQGHMFRYINMFTLCLCAGCHEPLWGAHSQGLKCMTCCQFVHVGCATTNLRPCRSFEYDSSHMSIEWQNLRESCSAYYGDLLQLKRDDLQRKGFEEVSVIKSMLWIQVQSLNNGVALGSLVITHKGKSAENRALDEFELHKSLALCEEVVGLEIVTVSEALDEYMQGGRISRSKHSMMFDWANLVYIAAAIKSPYTSQSNAGLGTPDLLMPRQADDSFGNSSNDTDHPFELVSLTHIRNALGYEFNIHSENVANFLLMYLHHLGFFERRDRSLELFKDKGKKVIACVFPLPLGLDLSTDVETLFASIEACLNDLDLSVNETGFLLLSRRLPPNNMASDYAMRRLMRAIINWIFAEV